ncbi:leucyl aminopeptidase family protein [Caulobacter sp. 17J80-11]|uniref:leucyl aminopeptidase family protein n=1 Tax=Caulobacter sp. 17J80-11 TaxID=2763502 RepID=UPI0016538944|nr:leucyl aminopeptidase family protein [Caulobacter sp. 17J80-11]
MHDVLITAAQSAAAIPVQLMLEEEFKALPEGVLRATCEAQRFKAQSGHVASISGPDGKLERIIWGLGGKLEPMSLRALPTKLPAGDYVIENPPADAGEMVALAWALGSYVFDRYKKREDRVRPRLVAPEGVNLDHVRHVAGACELAREMVDTPAADMGPLQIETIAREIAEAHGARIGVVTGADLLEENYPAVHAVGRAAAPHRAPRVIELAWREDRAELPLIALVGKGVVFDSGGLDIKPASGMRNMKKDMGGAAHALALGRLIMQADLPVRLVVLVAAVENAISGDAFRPGDVLSTRLGKTIEIGNTDAEGRVILSDVLARAGELEPTLTFDFATLTGAARVALGPELPPFYTDDEGLAVEIAAAAKAHADPMWRMPLWPGYQDAVKSDIADVRNDSADWAQAGSVTAALFLKHFAPKAGSWTHFDVFAWNSRGRPGWPVGGEAQAIRAVFAMLAKRFPAAR